MHSVTLVILAAGCSTRFGRPKQLEPIGPMGETILDITLRDAFAAGCDEACVVVRPAHEALMRERYRQDRRVNVTVQHVPLGTGHAAMMGMEHAAGTCVVANGDDLYGPRSLRIAMHHAREGQPEEHALVAFGLGRTLTPNGPVNRAACIADADHLAGIEEVHGLQRLPDGVICDADERTWPDETPVSMNLWVLRERFVARLAHASRGLALAGAKELGLPNTVLHALAAGHAFRQLRTPDSWCGLTFPADAELVRRFLAQTP